MLLRLRPADPRRTTSPTLPDARRTDARLDDRARRHHRSAADRRAEHRRRTRARPAYYWMLWLGRVIVGPFTDNLPHAGGITVALLQSIADTWLLRRAVAPRRTGAGAGDVPVRSRRRRLISRSRRVIWNPPVAAALSRWRRRWRLSLGDEPPRWKVAATAALAWLAVQAHLSAVLVAAPLFAALASQPLVKRELDAAPASVPRSPLPCCWCCRFPSAISYVRQPEAAVGPTGALARHRARHLVRRGQELQRGGQCQPVTCSCTRATRGGSRSRCSSPRSSC